MADNVDFSSYAGRVIFPRNPSDLLSTTLCPACFATLESTICSACALDLGHPAAAELHAASLATAAQLDKRLAIIGQIRYETAHAAAQRVAPHIDEAQSTAALASASASASATATTVPAPISAPAAAFVAPTLPSPTSMQAAPSAAPLVSQPVAPPRKHSSVQIVLLIVGISLLSLAAIFFTILAFVTYGPLVRTSIIAAITVGAIVTATLLRRRNLTAGAEGVAVFAVVLVYGDAWALHSNNYFGLGRVDGTTYWGIVLLVSAVAFILWNRMSALRAPSIVAFSVFAPGVGLIVGGLLRDSELGTRSFFIAATIAIAGLIHRFAIPRTTVAPDVGGSRNVERTISLSTTVIALFVGFLVAFGVAPHTDWSGAIAVLALSIIAAAHLWAVGSQFAHQRERAFGYIFSSLGAIFAASAMGLAAFRITEWAFVIMAPVIAAAVVALALEAIVVRGAVAWKRFSTVAAWSAAGVFAVSLLLPVFAIVSANVARVVNGITNRWSMLPEDVIRVPVDTDGWAVLALAIVGTVATLSWTATKTLNRRGPIVAWLGAVVLTAAVAITSIVWVTVAGWLALAAISITVLSLPVLRAKIPATYRAPLAATTIVASVLGYSLSWVSTSIWWIGSIVVILVLVVSRLLTKSHTVKAGLLAIAAVLALIASDAAAHHITLDTSPLVGIDFINGVRFVSMTAAVILVLSATPLGRWLTHADRRVMFWLGGTVTIVTTVMLMVEIDNLSGTGRLLLLLPEFATSLIVALVMLAGFVMWVALQKAKALRPEHITASILTAPAVYFAVISLTKLAALPEFAITVAPIVSALIAAAVALTVATLRPGAATRWALDIGVVLVALPAVVAAAITGGEFAWFVLVLAAVAVLVLSIDNDGLFTSSSWRRHLGWVSLVFATAGLWWRLAGNDVTDLEPYVLPLSGALIIIAFLISWANARKSEGQPQQQSKAAPLIALSGLLVAILPLSINASSGTQLRALIIGAVAAALLLAGSFIVANPAVQRWWDSAALAGAIGVVVLMVGRAIYLPFTDVSRDAWIVGGFVCLLAAAFGQALSRTGSADRMRSIGSQALGIIGMTAVLLTEAPAFVEATNGQLRALGIVMLFAAIHVIALALDRAPFTRLVGWIAISFAGIAALTGSALGTIETPEFASVPIALALLAAGINHMNGVPAARSWGWLAPGLVVLLLPSLMETFRDQALWRIVGLGLVSIAVVIIGLLRKLQAPFVVGIIVVLIHGIATFAPQLRTAFGFIPWYLWLAVGGILFTWLAIRFEQRKRDMKKVVMKFAELR